MEEKKINREWVKTAAIIFLAVLLVLTFFSNTIMNRTLPEVASAEVTDGPITAKIRGTGTVSSVGQTEVKANATQSVATVKAREGAEVKAGDVLFVMGEAGEELENALEMLENAKFSLMEAYNGYPVDSASGDLTYAQREKDDADKALAAAAAASKDDAQVKELNTKLDQLKTQLDNLFSAYTVAVNEISAAETALADAESKEALAESAYFADPDNTAKKANYDAAVQAVADAQEALETAKASGAEVINAYEGLQSDYNSYSAQLESRLATLDANYSIAYERAQNAETALRAAEAAVANADASNGKAAQSANIAVARAQADINRWEKKVAELSGGEDYAIKAPIGGTISALSVSPGEKVSKDQVMCIIEVPDLGYQMSFSVTNDQVKRIKVGDPATVSSFFWGSAIEAEVSSIKVDPKDPQSKKLITCTLDGDVEPGSEISVSIGNKSANYDVIVPNSAVRTDSNGSFVLMITSKNSPLGNRYFAERVPVEVLASDDTNSALNANLGYGDFVITTSSSPIKNGDQVRMADNG